MNTQDWLSLIIFIIHKFYKHEIFYLWKHSNFRNYYVLEISKINHVLAIPYLKYTMLKLYINLDYQKFTKILKI